MASSDSVGFGWMPAIRAAQHHLNDAVFRRESFLCVRLVVTTAFTGHQLPAPFQLGEPALPPQILTSPVARTVRRRGFHLSMPRVRLVGDARCYRACQDRFTARRLELTTSRPRMPSIGSIPTLSGWESLRVEKLNPLLVAGAPLPSTHSFPPVKVMGRRRRLAPAVPPGQ
jgi:hypothetical protein